MFMLAFPNSLHAPTQDLIDFAKVSEIIGAVESLFLFPKTFDHRTPQERIQVLWEIRVYVRGAIAYAVLSRALTPPATKKS